MRCWQNQRARQEDARGMMNLTRAHRPFTTVRESVRCAPISVAIREPFEYSLSMSLMRVASGESMFSKSWKYVALPEARPHDVAA